MINGPQAKLQGSYAGTIILPIGRSANGRPSGSPIDVLTGFLSGRGAAFGRPVGVAMDRAGALLVADDVGNVVWRVTPAH